MTGGGSLFFRRISERTGVVGLGREGEGVGSGGKGAGGVGRGGTGRDWEGRVGGEAGVSDKEILT